MWELSALERVSGDLRYAARQLIRRPAWTLMVVSTLALGVGANTSIFTLVDTMLFKPAPWNQDGRLVWISAVAGRSSGPGHMSYPDYVAYRDHATTLSGVLAYSGNLCLVTIIASYIPARRAANLDPLAALRHE